MNIQASTNNPHTQKINPEDFLRAREAFHRTAWQFLGQYLESGGLGADADVAADMKAWWDSHQEGAPIVEDWPDPIGEAVSVVFLGLLTTEEVKGLTS